MNTKLQKQSVSTSQLLRWGAEATGILLVVGWLGFVFAELVRTQFEMPTRDAFYQAAALIIIFSGYAFLWRHALAGSALVILGTVTFFAISWLTSGFVPRWDAILFAIPGVLALLALGLDRRRNDAA